MQRLNFAREYAYQSEYNAGKKCETKLQYSNRLCWFQGSRPSSAHSHFNVDPLEAF